MKFLVFLLEGAFVSIQIFFLTLIFALPLGLLISLGRMSRRKWISEPIKLYIDIMRGTPLILQIIIVYFAPFYIFGISLDRFVAAVVAFVLNYAAYFAEIFRGGIESIEPGQYEAADVLGFTKVQTFVRVILPQVIKRILPATSNEVITLVKDTALVQVVGVSELFRIAQNESTRIFSIKPLLIAGVFYFVLNWLVIKVFHFAEKKLKYYR